MVDFVLMLKAIGRAVLLIAILVVIGMALWLYTTVAIIALVVIIVFGWLTFMLYTDPPEDWN